MALPDLAWFDALSSQSERGKVVLNYSV